MKQKSRARKAGVAITLPFSTWAFMIVFIIATFFMTAAFVMFLLLDTSRTKDRNVLFPSWRQGQTTWKLSLRQQQQSTTTIIIIQQQTSREYLESVWTWVSSQPFASDPTLCGHQIAACTTVSNAIQYALWYLQLSIWASSRIPYRLAINGLYCKLESRQYHRTNHYFSRTVSFRVRQWHSNNNQIPESRSPVPHNSRSRYHEGSGTVK